jgi:hypothetical protein
MRISEHLLKVHHMPNLLYAGLDPDLVHLQAHRDAALAVLTAEIGPGLVTDLNVEAVAMASIDAEGIE